MICVSIVFFLGTLAFSLDNTNAEKGNYDEELDYIIEENIHQNELQDPNGYKYKIGEIKYNPTGITKVSALKRSVEISTDKLFDSREELEKYSDNIIQQLNNKRLFDEITKEATENPANEDGIVLVDYVITVSDSKNFLIFPKPNYSSNSGAELKIKMKDSNFLGFMNTLNFDLNSEFGTSSDPTDFSKVTLGVNFDYVYPFSIGITQNNWSNDFGFSWMIGDVPEFSYSTGITMGIPFGSNMLQARVIQSIRRENDYQAAGDELFFTEAAGLYLPLTLGYIGDIIPLRYTPSISVNYNWDLNGIKHSSLVGPVIDISQNLSMYAVNWHGNFRDGYSFSAEHNISYNFATENIIPFIAFSADFFKSFKYVGINSRLYAYGVTNSSQNRIGSRLRGTLDEQSALYSDMALSLNLDIPIHVVTTDWLGWAAALWGPYDEKSEKAQKFLKFPRKLFGALNFEMQVSPFFDMALTHNNKTGRTFSLKDGYYDAGIEVLIFPTRFRNYVVRGSVGFDLARTLLKDVVDTSWRDQSKKKYEIFIGLGLHY